MAGFDLNDDSTMSAEQLNATLGANITAVNGHSVELWGLPCGKECYAISVASALTFMAGVYQVKDQVHSDLKMSECNFYMWYTRCVPACSKCYSIWQAANSVQCSSHCWSPGHDGCVPTWLRLCIPIVSHVGWFCNWSIFYHPDRAGEIPARSEDSPATRLRDSRLHLD